MNAHASGDSAHAISRPELPDDPADLFVVLYDLLPDEHFQGQEAIEWVHDPAVRVRADQVCTSVLKAGRVTAELAAEIAAEIQVPGGRATFAVLTGLDWALGSVNPFSPCYDEPTMAWLARRYIQYNRLNNPRGATAGLLLPRCTRPGKVLAEWTGKPDFFNVHRVTPDNCRRIRLGRIPDRNDPAFSGGKPISVGAVPMLEKYTELEFAQEKKNGAMRYRITPSTARLQDRVGQVIRNLGESEAVIGVLPESTLSEPLLERWDDLRGELPEDSALQWILLGTGPVGDSDPKPNRAVLVDCLTGRAVLQQDKMAGFTLTADLAAQWRLPLTTHNGLAVEDITRGLHVTVLESSLGRIAVLICEDIKQSVGWAAKLQALGVSHIFVPLFAAPITREWAAWERQAAQHCVEEFGAWVVLVNSLAIGAEMRTAAPDTDSEDDTGRMDNAFNCVVVGPRTRKPVKYGDYDTQFCRADSAAGVSRVVFRNRTKLDAPGDGDRPTLPTVERGWASW
ncbi:hypothetical protein [Streptomyces griseorubiginosus]|uniref:hypothetical protein n=1 Tax=Streptomyces griseorubiginosus TaxID=67304 RepID=UPI001AD67C99|nr:hypothetical protein [Streptomyces griseorubiginosus]MBO4258375.1 hypothetical protein [Streptomyces griseorubiginosus]